MQARWSPGAGEFPCGDIRVLVVLALSLALLGLAFGTEMGTAGFVTVQSVNAHQFGEFEKVADPAGALQRLVQLFAVPGDFHVVPELFPEPADQRDGMFKAWRGALHPAEEIKSAQGPEIELMESWLDDWGTPMADMGDMDHRGDGMMSDTDMQALEEASVVEASRLFLSQMIVHHEGAIEMAQREVDNGQNPDVITLAEDIIASQTAEITTMEDILATL